MNRSLKSAFVVAIVALVSCVSSVHAETQVSGSVSTDTVWTAANGPYIVNTDFAVFAPATLTIEPGTIVKFARNAYLLVGGAISAQGTAGEPIIFTSLADDTVGGDTNGDSTDTVPTVGSWSRVANVGGTINLDHVEIRYGGGGGIGSIANIAGATNVSHSLIRDALSYGVWQNGGTITTTSTTIKNSGTGLFLAGTSATIDTTILEDNVTGIESSVPVLSITSSEFNNNGTHANISASSQFTHSGNSATGSAPKGFTLVSGGIDTNTTWRAGDMPYLLTTDITMHSGAVLTIEPGTVIKFSGNSALNSGDSTITAIGTEAQPIIFTSLRDDTAGGDTNGDGATTAPVSGSWGRLSVVSGNLNLDHVEVRYGGMGGYGSVLSLGGATTFNHSIVQNSHLYGFWQSGGVATITNSTIKNSGTGLYSEAGTVALHQSAVTGNTHGVVNSGIATIDATNTYWGAPSGPFNLTENPAGLGNSVSAGVSFIPWLETDQTNDACPQCSNVMFLPGLMGSELEDGAGGRHWLSTSDANAEYLRMNADGTSQHLDIAATQPISEVFVLGAYRNVYKSFLNDMRNWESSLKIKTKTIPYDWRLDYNDVATKGRMLSNGTISYTLPPLSGQDPYIIKTLKELALTSKTGKVTIVAHSQGGLIAKALTNKLGAEASQYIDKIIFVATPHLGAPKAVGALLNGSDVAIPAEWIQTRITTAKGRDLGQNFPSAYNLLPSQKYFDAVATPVISIDANDFPTWASAYGTTMHSRVGLDNFMADTSHTRVVPAVSDTLNPQIVNTSLLEQSNTVHDALDAWVAPQGVQTYAIAGWGEETISGIEYKKVLTCPTGATQLSAGKLVCVLPLITTLSPTINIAVEGDGVVPVVSAQGVSISQVNKYWIDLYTRNKVTSLGSIILGRQHSDILEVSHLRDFIANIVKSARGVPVPTDFVTSFMPTSIATARKHFTLHSPLTLGITDSNGNHAGMNASGVIENTIPNAHYEQIGDVQWLSIPDDIAGTLELHGTGNGSFTLDIEEVLGDTVTSHASFEAIPTLTTTTATIPITSNQPATTASTILSVDFDGNGTADIALPAIPNGTTVYDTTPPELTTTFNPTTKTVTLGAVDTIDEHPTLTKTGNTLTLTDSSNNTTTIPLTMYESASNHLEYSYTSITRNGITTQVPSTTIKYEWDASPSTLKQLDTKISIEGEAQYTFKYEKGPNKTTIKTKSPTTAVTRTGLVTPVLMTKGNTLQVSY